MKIIKNRVKFYRRKMNLSQKQVAKAIGISRQYLSEIENNKQKNIGGTIMIDLANLFGVTVEEIFFPSTKVDKLVS